MRDLQTVFMCGSVIGFIAIMLCNIVKTIENHGFLVGTILGILKGALCGAAWFFAWPATMWIFLWYRLKPGSYIEQHNDKPNTRNLSEQLLGIQKEPVYDFWGGEIGTARTFGDKIIDVDALGVSHDDLERDAFGDLRKKF